MTIMRIHRDVFPHTDHGHTWVECLWFEEHRQRTSPIIPAAGYCDRLGQLPGGPIRCDLAAERQHYAPNGVDRAISSQTTHDTVYYHVGTVCIVPSRD